MRYEVGCATFICVWTVLVSGIIQSTTPAKTGTGGGVEEAEEDQIVYTLSDEKRLIKRLLKNYEGAGITGRPVKNTNEKVLIEMSLSLIQILDLDEKNQVLTVSVWVLYHWTDHILKWDPEDYSQIQEVRVPPQQVWTPDIVLYNYADERLKEMRHAMVIVQYNGSITWMPQAIYKSSCKIDIMRFPFDEQTCHMKFGSWTYDGNRLDVSFISNDSRVLLDDYTESNEWEIMARPALRNVKYYPCCSEPYPDLTFFLFLRRNAAFFSYILVLPCVLLASLTLVIFWLPPESPAKMVLGMNIFVAFFLLLLLLADSTPQASTSVPYIGYYYCLNMILITLSSFLSVIVINLYFRGDRRNRVPLWIRKICELVTGSCIEGAKQKVLNKTDGNFTVTNPDAVPLMDRKSVTQSNGVTTTPYATSAVTKVKKGKTRFANDVHCEAPRGQSEALNQSVKETTGPNGLASGNTGYLCTQNSSVNSVLDQNTYLNKTTNQTLTPSTGFETTVNIPIKLPASEVSQTNHSTLPLHMNRPECKTCPFCASDMGNVGGVGPSDIYDQRSLLPAGDSEQSRHQRHPQNCLLCLQQLNAIRTQRYTNSMYSPSPDSCCQLPCDGLARREISAALNESTASESHLTKSYVPVGNEIHFPRCPHMYNTPNANYCDVNCTGPFKYEYRDGKLILTSARQNVCSCPHSSQFNNESMKYESKRPYAVEDPMQFLKMTKDLGGELQEIHKVIRSFLDRISKKDAENVIIREWRMVAMVMDRIFFLCYLVIHLCAAFGLLIPSSEEANVLEYLREYRLKNYNASYSEEEFFKTIGVTIPVTEPTIVTQPSSLKTPNEMPSENLDRTKSIIPAENPIPVLKTAIAQSQSAEMKVSGEMPSPATLEMSPYQRFVDKKKEPAGTSLTYLPEPG